MISLINDTKVYFFKYLVPTLRFQIFQIESQLTVYFLPKQNLFLNLNLSNNEKP